MLLPPTFMTPRRTAYSVTSGTPNAANSIFASFTNFNQSVPLRNDTTITSLGIFADSAATIVLKIALRVSSGTRDVVVSQSVSHGGAGWQDFQLTTPYYIPETGTYYIGGYSTSSAISAISADRGFKSGDITGTGQSGFTEDTNNTCGVRANGYNGK